MTNLPRTSFILLKDLLWFPAASVPCLYPFSKLISLSFSTVSQRAPSFQLRLVFSLSLCFIPFLSPEFLSFLINSLIHLSQPDPPLRHLTTKSTHISMRRYKRKSGPRRILKHKFTNHRLAGPLLLRFKFINTFPDSQNKKGEMKCTPFLFFLKETNFFYY